jgi:hypothetical protein
MFDPPNSFDSIVSFIGLKNPNVYTPLTRAGTEALVTFSPKDKYLLITEYKLDSKTGKRGSSYVTRIVDASTGKVMWELAVYDRKYKNHMYNWNYGDELVELYFFDYARAGYGK